MLIVEHHREVVKLADHVVDMGPGAGSRGGEVVFEGSYDELLEVRHNHGADAPDEKPLQNGAARTERLVPRRADEPAQPQDVSVDLPLGVMTVIAGVAGSGKSSLMESFQNQIKEEVIFIGQKNIGINLRSTPATLPRRRRRHTRDIRRGKTRSPPRGSASTQRAPAPPAEARA